MKWSVDFHTHSYHSDGRGFPRELPVRAKGNNPKIQHLSLSDHNTFSGCAEFMDACTEHGIQGYVSSEISGSYPGKACEFHFLSNFGPEWNEDIAKKVKAFDPYFNELNFTDTQNIFLFLRALSSQGIDVSYKDLIGDMVRRLADNDAVDYVPALSCLSFGQVRKSLKERGIYASFDGTPSQFEQQIWAAADITPLPTPSIQSAYAIFQQTQPKVVLAHPMIYGYTVDEMRPLIVEWKEQIGLMGLEAFYGGEIHQAWQLLAEELGLLVSVGSDSHTMYRGEHGIPDIDQKDLDVAALIEAFSH